MQAIGILLLLASTALYLYLIARVLPGNLLRLRYVVTQPVGRGLKRCLFEGKRCCVYQPDRQTLPYVHQYLLLEKDDQKVLKCKVSEDVEYMDYDVIVFDRHDKVTSVIHVKENILLSPYTRETVLPPDASYVRLRVRQVNGNAKEDSTPLMSLSVGKAILYVITVILLTAIQCLVMRISCAFIFGGVFREDFIRSDFGLISCGVLSLAMGLLSLVVALRKASICNKE